MSYIAPTHAVLITVTHCTNYAYTKNGFQSPVFHYAIKGKCFSFSDFFKIWGLQAYLT